MSTTPRDPASVDAAVVETTAAESAVSATRVEGDADEGPLDASSLDDPSRPMRPRAEPAARTAAAQALVTLRTRVQRHWDDALVRTPEAFSCHAGCDACCHRRFSVFTIEAVRVRRALAALGQRSPALREKIRAQASDPAAATRCALLVDGQCAVYDERPMICRSHGLPLGWLADEDDPGSPSDHATLQVDVCALNFRAHEIPIESVLRLDAVDAPLAVMAELWDGGERVGLADLAAALDD